MGAHRRSWLGGVLLLTLAVASLTPAMSSSFAAVVGESQSDPPVADVIEAQSGHAALPPGRVSAATSHDRHVTRLLRLVPYVSVLLALALALAGPAHAITARPRRLARSSLLVASGVSRRGPPLVA